MNNDVALQAFCVKLLADTRGWRAAGEAGADALMTTPHGETVLVVTRNWLSAGGNTTLIRNGCEYAHRASGPWDRAVLIGLTVFRELGRAYAQPYVDLGLEVLDEQDVADMAYASGVTTMEAYARIVRETSYSPRAPLEPRRPTSRILNGEGDVVARWDERTRFVEIAMPRSIASRVPDMAVRDPATGANRGVPFSDWLREKGDKGYELRYGNASLPKAA